MVEKIGMVIAVLLGLMVIGLFALWIGNHGNRPTYAAMSHRWDESYQPPRDTGLLVVANGVFLFADQRRGAPAPTLFVPYWMLIVLAAIWPVWFGRRQLLEQARRRREAHGLCWCCAYDLRVTPQRCPECGSVPRRSLSQKKVQRS